MIIIYIVLKGKEKKRKINLKINRYMSFAPLLFQAYSADQPVTNTVVSRRTRLAEPGNSHTYELLAWEVGIR